MNHDYAHCADYTKDCPKDCFRAELARDLKEHPEYGRMLLSYASLKGTGYCPLKTKEDEV